MPDKNAAWPSLPPLADWQDTFETVHLWTQIVGKIRLEQGAPVNHSWGSTLYITPRGLTTSSMPHGSRSFEIGFDFIDHALRIADSRGRVQSIELRPMSVAAFYRGLMQALDELDLGVNIYPWPVEMPDPIRAFDADEQHASYDPEPVRLFWSALLQVDRVFKTFRSRYIGKSSPVHFFWGAYDLAVTRFSGRAAPRHPGGVPNTPDRVMVEAYSHELASAGFWPGQGVGEASFYAYAYPEPEGFKDAAVAPAQAYYHGELREFLLPYSAVREAADPDDALLHFLESTYGAAADLGKWDRARLERSTAPH